MKNPETPKKASTETHDVSKSISLTNDEWIALEAAAKGRSLTEFLKSIALTSSKKPKKKSVSKKTVSATKPDPNKPVMVLGLHGLRHTTIGALEEESLAFNLNLQIKHEIMNSSDRSAGILGGAFVEDGLKNLIASCWKKTEGHEYPADVAKKVFSFNGPLGTFGVKIRIARLAGMIGPSTFKDLEAIREIRNTCAHYMSLESVGTDSGFIPVSFDEERLKGWCDGLIYAK